MIRSILSNAARSFGPNVALVSSAQDIVWTYSELNDRVLSMASTLMDNNEKPGEDAVSMRLDNCAENVVTQLACASVGVPVFTYKTGGDLADSVATSHLVASTETIAQVMADVFPTSSSDEIGNPDSGAVIFHRPTDSTKLDATQKKLILNLVGLVGNESSEQNFPAPPFFYSSATGVPFEHLIAGGDLMGKYMNLKEGDRLCLPVTLNHTFGMAGALAAFGIGSSVVLPSPKPDPDSTLAAIRNSGATVLLADTHTLKALEGTAAPASLRGGLVKVGSGEVLGAADPVLWGELPFATVGTPR
mmetsp:Transcript_32094/g.63986  ORF Transcript_32094/g.63986 Transcript_32094/m.63986 type:complete len:303 (+) Transcript_32094:13-921(+)